jgi:hypothetical protein
MFKTEKVHFIIYSLKSDRCAQDFFSAKVFFMAVRETSLIDYVKGFL